jgi:Na+-translocating ferredoxin:NAD+ oxidoreductase RnfG subunit
MKFTKNDIKPVIVLGVIFLVAAVLIAGINVFTAPEVEKREQQAINDSLSAVMPGGEFENVTTEFDLIGTSVTAVYKNTATEGGYVVTLSTAKGYTGNPILLTIAIVDGEVVDGVAQGKIVGAVVTSNPESKGVDQTNAFFEGLVGKNPNETFETDLITGVTYSSTAVRNAALDAFDVLGYKVPTVEETPRIENITAWSFAGIAVAVLVIGGAVAYTIVKRRKGI